MLLSRETRKKLSALRRRSRSEGEADEPPPAGAPEREGEVAPEESAPPVLRAPLAGAPVPVEALFPGESVEGELGSCYVMRPNLAALGDPSPVLHGVLGCCAGAGLGSEVAFIDIETLGLASMPVFLVGVLRVRRGALELTQILARDLPEEAALLGETVAALQGAQALFSYNGATFDLPLLQERAIYHAVDWWLETEHIDLLKPARRRYRHSFADCKLQTLETHLCGRRREDDIPGAEIPRRYYEFVRSADGRLLQSIIRHNQLDLVTLAELVPHCLG